MPKYLCAPLVLLVLATAGCGGDGGPSKKEYIADLNKICKRTGEKIQTIKVQPTLKGFGSYARQTRPIVRDSVKQAENLELPDEKRDELNAFVQGSKDSLSELDDLQKAADAGDAAAVKRVFARTAEGGKKRDAQAKKLGLKQCGSG